MGEKLTNTPAEAGLQFFGRISASISHELKNVLAIINENAGLLEDFAFMANRGKPIDPKRLKSMAAAVQKQVSRADLILKNMNRFAHSIDESVTDVDLGQLLELVIALTGRFADMQQVRVELQLPPESPTVRTAPFHLIQLVCLCLDFSMSALRNKKSLELTIAKTEDGFLIDFNGLAALTPELLETFPSDSENNLLAVLAADLKAGAGEEKISLRLPKTME